MTGLEIIIIGVVFWLFYRGVQNKGDRMMEDIDRKMLENRGTSEGAYYLGKGCLMSIVIFILLFAVVVGGMGSGLYLLADDIEAARQRYETTQMDR